MTPRFARLAVPALIGSALLIGACTAAPVTTTGRSPLAVSGSTGPSRTAAATPSPTTPPTLSPTVAPVLVSPDPSAPASGTANKISITDARFSVATLAAPANKTWTLQVDFKDPLGAHNFTLESGPSVAERVFQSPKFGTGKHDYVLPGLPAGNYVFVCTLHPETMHGVLEIG